MSDYTPTNRPFNADCWRCASLAADRLPKDSLDRFSRRMYLCPECGDKRCRKASDHEFKCDKGEGSRRDMETAALFRRSLDEVAEARGAERERQNADHAVAIEREAIAAWHEHKSAQCIEYLAEHPEVGENMREAIRTEGIVHAVAADAVRTGKHHEGTEGT